MNIVVFAYDFPHQKSFLGLSWLKIAQQRRPELEITVVLQPRKVLNVPRSKRPIIPSGLEFPNTIDACEAYGFTWTQMEHDDFKRGYLERDLGIILGARILKPATIEAFRLGVLNMHPGTLPENRGLDNIKWALIKGLPFRVTAHLIDSTIDRGVHVCHRDIELDEHDSLHSLYQKHLNAEMLCMVQALDEVRRAKNADVRLGKGTYHSAVPDDQDALLDTLLKDRKFFTKYIKELYAKT